jgi:Putative auto-transporter adhesin, head GIN domain
MAGLGRMGRGAIAKLIAAATLAITIVADPAQAEDRKMLVASFENIVVIGDITVAVETGKAPSARASGDKRMLDSLKLERVGTTLKVRLQDVINNEKGRPMTAPLYIMLSTRALKDVTLSGNGKLTINAVVQPTLSRILIVGGGRIDVGRLEADQLAVNISGNGTVAIGGGTVRDSKIVVDGSGQYNAGGLHSRKLRLQHDGNATSSAWVDEGSDIFNSGTGSITIAGPGTCFIKKAGAASINCTKVDKGSSK